MRTLNTAQQDVVAHYNGFGVPIQWFIGQEHDDGSVEVIGLGEDFIWSLLIEENGDHSTSEASLGEFSTGITV